VKLSLLLQVYAYMAERLAMVATKHNERLLVTSANPISIGMTLSAIGECSGFKLGAPCLVQYVLDFAEP
jgi:hypothetical protein